MRCFAPIAVLLLLSGGLVVHAGPDETPHERRERLAREHEELPGRMLQRLIDRARRTPLALRSETRGDEFQTKASATWAFQKDDRLQVQLSLHLDTEPGAALARLEELALDAPRSTTQDEADERRHRTRGLPTEWFEMKRRLNEVIETAPDGRPWYPPTGTAIRLPQGKRPHDLYQDLSRGRRTHLRRRAQRGWLVLEGVHRERHGAGTRRVKTPDGAVDEIHPGTAVEGELRLHGLVLPPGTREVAVSIELSISYAQVDDARAPHFGKGTWPAEEISKPQELLRIKDGRVPLEGELLALFEALAGPLDKEAAGAFDGIAELPGVWFHGRHITLVGTPLESVRNHAQQLEDIHQRLAERLQRTEFEGAETDVTEYVKALSALGAAIREAKEPHPQAEWSSFECRAFLRGLPTDAVIADQAVLEGLFAHWKEMGTIARGNVRDIGRLLVKKTETFSANVLKSVVKNYIHWAGAVPAAPERIATLLGEKAALTPWDLPRSASSWIAAAERDASILTDQQRSLAELERLLAFYGERDKTSVQECERLIGLVRVREPAELLHRRLRDAVEWLDWASWHGRPHR